jgi:hypothetical protein
VTGLLGLVLCWVPWLGVLLAGVGVVLSGIGIAQGKKKGASIGLAIAGLVCGIIALIPATIIMVALFQVASDCRPTTPEQVYGHGSAHGPRRSGRRPVTRPGPLTLTT